VREARLRALACWGAGFDVLRAGIGVLGCEL
jgi:hypothetical protein